MEPEREVEPVGLVAGVGEFDNELDVLCEKNEEAVMVLTDVNETLGDPDGEIVFKGVRDVQGLPLEEIVLKLERLMENIAVVVFVTELEVELEKYPDIEGVWLIEIVELEELDEVWEGEFVEESEGLLDWLTDELCEGDDVKDKVKLEEPELTSELEGLELDVFPFVIELDKVAV